MEEAGVKPRDIPPQNFHIIPPDLYQKLTGKDTVARSFLLRQGALFNAWYVRDNPVLFGAVVLHEMLHLKAYLCIEVGEQGGKVQKTSYREGVTVEAHRHRGKHHGHFTGLHEAIVAEAEKRFLPELMNHLALAAEKEWLKFQEAKEMKKKLAEEEGIPEGDIIWVGKEKGDWKAVSYSSQRDVLNYVCAEIQKQFPQQFKNPDEVYNLFLRAHFTGRLLLIARLVEKTFGEGSFRLLGNMGTDSESGVLHLESLKRVRLQKTRKKADS